MNSLLSEMRAISEKRVQIYQLQFVGLLLVLLVILGSKLGAGVKTTLAENKKLQVLKQTPITELNLGNIFQGEPTLDRNRIENLKYLVEHHNLRAVIDLPNQSAVTNSLTIADKITAKLISLNIAKELFTIRIRSKNDQEDILVTLEKLPEAERVM